MWIDRRGGEHLTGIIRAFVELNALKRDPKAWELGLQDVADVDGDIFRCGNRGREILDIFIKEVMIERFDYFSSEQFMQRSEFDRHPRTFIHLADHGYFQEVVVAVTIGAGALAVYGAIGVVVEVGTRETMSGAKVRGDG